MDWFFLTVEILFVGVLLAGVALIYVPAAMILGGGLGIWAMERAIHAHSELKRSEAEKVAPMARRRA